MSYRYVRSTQLPVDCINSKIYTYSQILNSISAPDNMQLLVLMVSVTNKPEIQHFQMI